MIEQQLEMLEQGMPHVENAVAVIFCLALMRSQTHYCIQLRVTSFLFLFDFKGHKHIELCLQKEAVIKCFGNMTCKKIMKE